MVSLSHAEFEELVAQALEALPPELLALIDNVAIFVEDEAPDDEPDLLGLYEGVPLTKRDQGWGLGNLPDHIRLFQGPLQRMCADRHELREEVMITVVHEIAHHFGIDDDRLHDLGWG